MAESKNPYRSKKRQKDSDEFEGYEFPAWLYDDGTLDKTLAAEYSVKRDALIENIRAAFASVKHPGNDKIGDGMGEYYSIDPEFLPAFKGKTWEDISLETADRYSYEFFQMFYPTGQRYFLPMFLITTLRYPDTMHGVFLVFLPSTPAHQWSDVSPLLDDNQKRIMVEFFKFLKFMFYDDEDIDANIKFWEETLRDK
jgi:hypothetical protein